jgi:DNA-binding NtrC family response regulator
MLTILLIDDEPDLLALLGAVLRDEGHTVDLAPDAEIAMERLAACSFDLVVSDVRLPKVDGLTLCHRIRREFPLTEVLLMTAYGPSIGDIVTAMNDSAVAYLRKPFEFDHLVSAVTRIEERRRSKDEHAGSLVLGAPVHSDCPALTALTDVITPSEIERAT